jgi:hypothetical protein
LTPFKKKSVEEKKLKINRLAQQQALSWDEGDISSSHKGGLKIVVIKNALSMEERKGFALNVISILRPCFLY